ncbi:GGDEF domain-containing protein [Pseudoxanthomonas sp. SE1]|uniref:tetratricopeptide repeat-containing diguanylate cyclase n=1 Tax=Pseudoxanthomonas sp. SE1 TaxID=1664560 RepID=UPI00240E0D66|nr:GGDEF domain-containing protein [Pseudoxanthomonas sp. SE1]WFC43557.1 GGDEF domain-containing protein [Pseudoxanthomonas sp. SE1]
MRLGKGRTLWLAAALACVFAAPVQAQVSPGIDALIEQAEAIKTSQPAKFYDLLERLEKRVEEATPEQRLKLRLLRAHGFLMKGRAEPAIRELRQIQQETDDPEMLFWTGSLLVNTYALTRKFEQGLTTLNDILPLATKVEKKDVRHRGLLVAGLLYNQVGEYMLGEQYANQVLADAPEGRNQCAAGNLVAEAALGLKKAPSEEMIFRTIKVCEDQKEPILGGLTRTYLARKWVEDGKVDQAIELLERYLPTVTATGYPLVISEYHAMLASMYLKLGDIGTAQAHANEAVERGVGMTSLPLVVAYKTLYEIAESRGDSKAALSRYRQYADADKAYLNDVKTRQLAYQIVRQQILQKTQQISMLDQENQVLQLQRTVDQQAAQNTRLIVILLVLLVASIGYWAFKIKRVQLSLKKMAETDALTGICNRHHFTLRAERALAECARNGEQAALIMFDLDHFKNINDRFGHGTGDWALKEVAEASKGFCRRIDVLGRLGGEEFAILMYGCDLRAAARVAEDCRVRLAQIETRETGHVFAITGSFGVTSSVQSGYSLAKLLSHADKQLYRAKHLGRNRVCVHENEHENVRASGSNVLELPQREGRTEHLGA